MPKKRTDGRYEVKVRVSRPGEPRRYKSFYAETLRDARAKADEYKRTASVGGTMKKMTVSQAIDYWLSEKEGRVRPQTLYNYNSALNHAKRLMGKRLISSVTVDDARWLHRTVAEQFPTQANRVANRMYAVFKDAIARGMITQNPFEYVNAIKVDSKKTRALTPEELKKIDEADIPPMDRAFISVLRYTGMRRGEASALSVKDLNFEERYINIDKTNIDGECRPPKTATSVRKVPMPDVLAEILRGYLESYYPGDGSILFPNMAGHLATNYRQHMRWWSVARKIFDGHPPADFTPHIFRHTYASELAKNHVPPVTAMLLLGHRSIRTTMDIYTHLGYKDIDAEQINNIFRDN